MREEQGHKLRLVAVLLAGPLAQFVGVEEQLRPPTRLVVVVVGLLLLVGLAAVVVVVVALELLRLLVVVVGAGALGAPRSCSSASCRSAAHLASLSRRFTIRAVGARGRLGASAEAVQPKPG